MTETLSPKDEYDFNVVYGCLFSLSVTTEYLDAVRVVMDDRKAKYVSNKSKEAQKACEFVKTTIEREITKRMNDEQKTIALGAVEQQKQIIYDFFLMDTNDQHRIKQLINKLKREKQ
jgi:predicted transcriptional regulator with HTH domain